MKAYKDHNYFFKRFCVYILVLITVYACFACVIPQKPGDKSNAPATDLSDTQNNDGGLEQNDSVPDIDLIEGNRGNRSNHLSDGTPLNLANSVGNSAANLANGGKMAFQGNAMYYANEADSNRLYKQTATENLKISDLSAFQINVLGEYVYFITYPFSRSLYRVPINGSGPAERLNFRSCDNLAAASDSLYYCDAADSYRIRKLNLNTLEDTGFDVVNAMYIHYFESFIYYQAYINNSYKLMRIDTQGNNETLILDLKQNCRAIAFYNGRIYHRAVVNVGGLTKYRFYSAALDGTDSKMLTANEPYFLNIAADTVYYSNCDDAYNLYSVKTDGTESKKVHSYATEYVYSDGNNVYTKAKNSDQTFALLT